LLSQRELAARPFSTVGTTSFQSLVLLSFLFGTGLRDHIEE
jgi:hypothetical protein